MPDEAVELAYARRPHLEPPSSKLETLLGDRATVHYEPTLSGAGYRRVIDVTPAQSTKSMKAYEKEAKRAKKEAEERNKRERKEREEREKVWEKEMREWEKEEAKREKMREKEKKEEERLSERERRREEMLKSMTSVGMSTKAAPTKPWQTPQRPPSPAPSFFASKPSALKATAKPSTWVTDRVIDSQTQERVYAGMSRAAAYAIMSLEEEDAKARGVAGWK